MGERDEDEILLPPGSTFRVVDYQVLVGGLRVIKLRHIGTWVSEEIYHRPEIEVRFLKNVRHFFWLQILSKVRSIWASLVDLRSGA